MNNSRDICPMKLKVLIIEDEIKTAHSLKAFLEEECDAMVDCAYDGYTGKRLALQNNYDMVFSDIILPNLNGVELCRQLRSEGLQTPILMLSALYQPEDKIAGLNAGADDYLAKPFDFHELVARLNAIIRRSKTITTQTNEISFADLSLNLLTLEVWRSGQKITLTPREFSLLEYLVKNPNRVIPKLEILEVVWGLNEDINTNVIEVYINYVRNKIDKNFPTKLIHTHFGVGYILKEETKA
jgi:two-component system copper resistance phosphate regulon response regulator CusR